MFAGGKRRSSNVRVMQIFHELKAQFPTIPDHIITSCIASHVAGDSPGNLQELVLAAAAEDQNQMGRPSIQVSIRNLLLLQKHDFLNRCLFFSLKHPPLSRFPQKPKPNQQPSIPHPKAAETIANESESAT